MDYVSAVGGAARSGLCFVLNRYVNAANWIMRRVTGSSSIRDTIGTSTAPYAQLYRWACNVEPPAPNFDTQAPFTGGQCPGVLYNINISWTQTYNGGAVWNGSSYLPNYYGEITSIVLLPLVVGQFPKIALSHHGEPPNPYTPNTTQQRVVDIGITGHQTGESTIINSISVTRVDGQTDNCGDVDVDIPEPPEGWNDYDTDITYNDNDNTEINIPVTFVFGFAFVNAKAELNIPFTLNVSPTLNFQGTLNVNTGDVHVDLFPSVTNNNGNTVFSFPNGSDTFNINNNFNVSGDRPDPTPNSNTNDKPPGTTNGTKKVIRGVIVTVFQLTSKKHTVLYQNENPDIYVPNLGFVQFKVSVDGIEAWTTDHPVKTLRHFIECPWVGGAIDVKGTPQPGIQFELYPVYAVSEAGAEYPAPATP